MAVVQLRGYIPYDPERVDWTRMMTVQTINLVSVDKVQIGRDAFKSLHAQVVVGIEHGCMDDPEIESFRASFRSLLSENGRLQMGSATVNFFEIRNEPWGDSAKPEWYKPHEGEWVAVDYLDIVNIDTGERLAHEEILETVFFAVRAYLRENDEEINRLLNA